MLDENWIKTIKKAITAKSRAAKVVANLNQAGNRDYGRSVDKNGQAATLHSIGRDKKQHADYYSAKSDRAGDKATELRRRMNSRYQRADNLGKRFNLPGYQTEEKIVPYSPTKSQFAVAKPVAKNKDEKKPMKDKSQLKESFLSKLRKYSGVQGMYINRKITKERDKIRADNEADKMSNAKTAKQVKDIAKRKMDRIDRLKQLTSRRKWNDRGYLSGSTEGRTMSKNPYITADLKKYVYNDRNKKYGVPGHFKEESLNEGIIRKIKRALTASRIKRDITDKTRDEWYDPKKLPQTFDQYRRASRAKRDRLESLEKRMAAMHGGNEIRAVMKYSNPKSPKELNYMGSNTTIDQNTNPRQTARKMMDASMNRYIQQQLETDHTKRLTKRNKTMH